MYRNGRTAVITWGRFNPPHKGHLKVFHKMDELSFKLSCEQTIFMSHAQNKSTDPLSFLEKWNILKQAWGQHNCVSHSLNFTNLFSILNHYKDIEYEKIILVCGQDRAYEYRNCIYPYLEHEDEKLRLGYELEVVPVGRDDYGDYSSTRLREYAKNNDYKRFRNEFIINNNEQYTNLLFETIKTRCQQHM